MFNGSHFASCACSMRPQPSATLRSLRVTDSNDYEGTGVASTASGSMINGGSASGGATATRMTWRSSTITKEVARG